MLIITKKNHMRITAYTACRARERHYEVHYNYETLNQVQRLEILYKSTKILKTNINNEFQHVKDNTEFMVGCVVYKRGLQCT